MCLFFYLCLYGNNKKVSRRGSPSRNTQSLGLAIAAATAATLSAAGLAAATTLFAATALTATLFAAAALILVSLISFCHFSYPLVDVHFFRTKF